MVSGRRTQAHGPGLEPGQPDPEAFREFRYPTVPVVLLTRRTLRERVGRPVDYIGSVDSTIAGSRSGHAPLVLWYAICRQGVDGLRARADASRELADYAVRRLRAIGMSAWRHPSAFTVVLPAPPPEIADRWMLATSGGMSHIICMPGVTRAQIDAFVGELGR
jgi:histidine decarboxylase